MVFALVGILKDARYRTRLILPTHKPFENNLHHIVNDFMIGGDDWWLTFDADNPPMNNPLDLISFNKDIIGCPTPVWHHDGRGDRPYYWNVYDYDEPSGAYREHERKIGLQRADAVGTGCVLFARRVFEDAEMRKAPFQRTYYADGRVEKGNDIAFCERARMRGFEVWAHYDYPCRHFNELELTEVITAFQEMTRA